MTLEQLRRASIMLRRTWFVTVSFTAAILAIASWANPALGAQRAASTSSRPTPGWVGERVVNRYVDDWEPAIATDPNAPYVYITTTRYGQPKTCSSHCPTPYIALTTSSDGGKTWGPQVPLCI